MQETLFSEDENSNASSPLAERMRPRTLNEVLGQNRLLGPKALLRKSLEQKKVPSMIFWGPPGCGKTTLAEVIKLETNLPFEKLSAVHSGVKDVKTALEKAKQIKWAGGKMILFIDEVHRFNKAQQDSLLHSVEEGLITLIGATTENPGFEVNSALLSRCQLLLFSPLANEDLKELLKQAVASHPLGLKRPDLNFSESVQNKLIAQADGDARFLLNQIEWLVDALDPNELEIDDEFLERIHYDKPLRYDKNGEQHYNMISVLHKSIRGSDVHAALYWLHRMLAGGEDPKYLLRRFIRMASEDVGNADSQALVLATSALQSFEMLGLPEGVLAIDQLVIYLCAAPKSNSVEMASMKADQLVKQYGNLPIPKAFRNAVNSTGKQLGYGEGYLYDHNSKDGFSAQEHLPNALSGTKVYEPVLRGAEIKIADRFEHLDNLRDQANQSSDSKN